MGELGVWVKIVLWFDEMQDVMTPEQIAAVMQGLGRVIAADKAGLKSDD